MAEKTPYSRFTEALDSIRDVVRNEINLIDLDAKHKANLNDLSDEALEAKLNNLSDAEKQIFTDAENEKESFLLFMRSDLQATISKIADERRASWKKIKRARAEKLEKGVEKLKAAVIEAERVSAGAEAVSATGAPSVCPPGFIEVDGICVPI